MIVVSVLLILVAVTLLALGLSSGSSGLLVASTTRRTASARATATSAWAFTRACRPSASGSHPPVSTTVKRRPLHVASYATRLRAPLTL